MWAQIAVAIISLVGFLVFGSLGWGLGERLEKKGVGTGLAPGCGVMIGVPCAGLIFWGLVKLFEAFSK